MMYTSTRASLAPSQFRYATLLDWLLMAVGTFCAICHGAALPVLMLLFGDLANAFTNEEISSLLINGSADGCDTIIQNATSLVSPSGTPLECSDFQNNPPNVSDVIQSCISTQYDCYDEDRFIFEINKLTYIFVSIGFAVLILGTVQIAFFQIASERQVQKIRKLFYRSILNQEIGWFDANPSGELSSRLTE